MDISRILRHLLMTERRAGRLLGPATFEAIERAIQASEARHGGELRFVVESSLDGAPLLNGQTPRERAIELFALLRVWDTAQNNGVLIYLLLADHAVEIVADRGVHAPVGDAGWRDINAAMEADFRAGRFEAGALAGIAAVTALLCRHFPARSDDVNELPDRPLLL